MERPWEGLPRDALDAWAPHLPALADEIIAAIRAEVPAYRRPLRGAFGQGVRRGVQEALGRFAQGVADPAAHEAGRRVYVALGRGEVREGRSLDALLAAYRVGAKIAWRRLAEAGLQAGMQPETLVLLAESIFAYIDEISAESAEGYAREQAERAGEADRRRAAALEALLHEPPVAEEVLAAAAEAARWPVPRELAIVVWAAEHGRRPLARLPLGTLAAPLGGLLCAVVPDPDGPGRRAEVEAALAGTPAGLGTTVGPAGAARSAERAQAALALAQDRGEDGVVAAADHRAALVLRAAPGLVQELARDRLAALDGETPGSRRRLRATLLAWLRHDGDVPAAAHELGVHPQTVRYRLARLRDLLGESTLAEPDARFELEVALRAGVDM